MKYQAPLLVVSNMEASKAFYKKVLGMRVTVDFGANVTLTGGFCLQTQESWAGFIDRQSSDISYRGKDHELYFEETDFDGFVERLAQMDGISYVHREKQFPWGQRVVRFYDPDGHIIEVGESMETVCVRFLEKGMSAEEISQRTMLPAELIEKFRKKAGLG